MLVNNIFEVCLKESFDEIFFDFFSDRSDQVSVSGSSDHFEAPGFRETAAPASAATEVPFSVFVAESDEPQPDHRLGEVVRQ